MVASSQSFWGQIFSSHKAWELWSLMILSRPVFSLSLSRETWRASESVGKLCFSFGVGFALLPDRHCGPCKHHGWLALRFAPPPVTAAPGKYSARLAGPLKSNAGYLFIIHMGRKHNPVARISPIKIFCHQIFLSLWCLLQFICYCTLQI